MIKKFKKQEIQRYQEYNDYHFYNKNDESITDEFIKQMSQDLDELTCEEFLEKYPKLVYPDSLQ